MSSQARASYQSYYDIKAGRSVPISSKIGQAQSLMSDYFPWHEAQSEQLLACRFAGTIHDGSEDRELRQLQRLLQYLRNTGFEKRHGFADPVVAREVEKEIILRSAPDFAAGYDITPAMRMLADMERKGPIFSQPERNLLLRCMFCTGNRGWTEGIADSMAEKNCPKEKLADICKELERIELSWLEMDTLDGQQYLPATHSFTSYPHVQLPPDGRVLMNGMLLHPVQDGWWQSDIQMADQTYTAPHYFKRSGQSFEIADEEYMLEQEEDMEFEEGGGMNLV